MNSLSSLSSFCFLLAVLCVGCPEEREESKSQKEKSEASGAPSPSADKETPKKTFEKAEQSHEGAPLPPLSPADALTFDVRNESLWVHSPQMSTSLGRRASRFKKSTIAGSRITIDYEDPIDCKLALSFSEDVSYFQAHLENTRAFRLYQRGNFLDAARGFKRAATLDETHDKARTNYIAALARAGDLKGAKAAFAVALKADPVTTYEKLLTDDDFEPLRAEFRTTKQVEPVLRFMGKDMPSYAGYSKERGLLSVVRQEVSWGAENWIAELHVFDATSRQLLSQHTLVRWQDTKEDGSRTPATKKEVDARLARFNETLTALQFRTLPKDRRADFIELEFNSQKFEAHISAFGQIVVAEKDTLRLLRQNDILDTFHSSLKGATPSTLYGIPELHSLIYLGAYQVAEGCDSGPGTLLEVFTTDHFGRATK